MFGFKGFSSLSKAVTSFFITCIVSMGLISLLYSFTLKPADETLPFVTNALDLAQSITDKPLFAEQSPQKETQSIGEWKQEFSSPLETLSEGTTIEVSELYDAIAKMDVGALNEAASQENLEQFKINAQKLSEQIQSRSIPENASDEQKRLMKDTDKAALRLADMASRASELAPQAREGNVLAVGELSVLGLKAEKDIQTIIKNLDELNK